MVKRNRTRVIKLPYQNTALLLVALLVFFFVADTPFVHGMLHEIGTYGYLGTFVAGMFFVSTFTIAPASLVLINMAETQSIFILALVAGAGGMVGDLIIFRFFKDQIFSELAPLFARFTGKGVLCLTCSPYFSWLMPIFGALIIASPFPDEIGIGMMGLGRIRTWQFMMLTFGLNTLGILLILSVYGM